MAVRILVAGGGTGGHLYPALNLASAIRLAAPEVRLHLLGAARGIEAEILPGTDIPYTLLPMQPLYRSQVWRNWRTVRAAPAVLGGLVRLFRAFDPHLVLGTGGYVSGPALLAGLLSGRRTALQEQNACPGLVTRTLAPMVDQLHLGYPEARRLLRPGRNTRLFTYGNPVAIEPPPARFDWPTGRTVAVIGGSQGARGINDRLLADLAEASQWPRDTTLVWVTGPAHYERIAREVARLDHAHRVRVTPFIPGLGSQLDCITLAVSRSGAMFCSELAAAGVPAVLVPFPAAAAGHQLDNATALTDAGGAVVLEEGAMQAGDLWGTVVGLLRQEERLQRMGQAMQRRGKPDAAEQIAGELLQLLAAERGGESAGG
jgi:UDP-N-acetylglucosamine--N-acetylmuramyl-(pentapeptide) pyrophosphoryl-undecaprenol N-acetylglucosamine transferase